MLDLAIATCARLPEPDPDAAPLADALTAAGLSFELTPWDVEHHRWPEARATLIRSTWNYPWHVASFAAWVDRVAEAATVWNPPEVVHWNLHKRYLLDLEADGLNVTPTELLGAGDGESLASILDRRGWSEAVVKPAVSAGSYRTLRTHRDDLDAGTAHLRALAAERDVLVQQYLPSVEDYGERALVWIDGEVTHAVRKTPRFQGDDESVSVDAMPISEPERALAQRAVAAVGGELLYARVDVAPGPDGLPMLMELELIEPSLFFLQGPAALDRLVAGIKLRLG
jgi:glutathione synthase/RimK-type ligase-like ATP-grasp enzyme